MPESDAPKKVSIWVLTSMVVGSMVGAGIFSLPQTFGRVTGPFGAMIAWAIAGGGMLMLALVFQTLSRRRPDLDAGVYAYAKAGFGDYPGFLSALGYWTVCCLGNVSYFILIKSTLGAVIPAFGDGNTPQAILVSSILLWTVHFLILRGVRQAAFINTLATIAKIIPILVFIVLVAMAFDSGLFWSGFWGDSPDADLSSLYSQVRGTMLVTVFVFVGIEGASVYSRYANKRSDVGIATIAGFLGVLLLMVLVTLLSYGVLTAPQLAGLRNPSMAGVLQAAVGPWGAVFVSIGLIISVSGAYLAWSLLAAEVLWSAAKTESMPAFLKYENRHRVPAAALWLTNGLIQLFLLMTIFSEQAFLMAIKLTSSMILVPYFLVAAYALKICWNGERRSRELTQSALATVYTAGLVYAGGFQFLLLTAIVYAPGTLLYVIARREQNRHVFTRSELLILVGLALAFCAAVYGLSSGWIVI